MKRSFGAFPAALDANGVEVKVRTSLCSAAVGELEGKQQRRTGDLETSVPRWFMGRAGVGGSYEQVRGPVYFEGF